MAPSPYCELLVTCCTPAMSTLIHQGATIADPGQGAKPDLTVLFGWCDSPKYVTEVLNPLIVIVWIQLRLVGLRMLSMGLHLAHLGPNLSIIKLQMAISEDLPAGHTR